MQAGRYKTLIEVHQCSTTYNDYGEQVKEYKFDRQTKANVVWNSGTRSSLNSQIEFPNVYTLLMHRYVNIVDDTHVKLQGKMYRVIEFHDDPVYNNQVVKIELITD